MIQVPRPPNVPLDVYERIRINREQQDIYYEWKKIKEEESKYYNNLSNIYDDEKVNTHEIFRKYLAYVNNNMYVDNDITDEDIERFNEYKSKLQSLGCKYESQVRHNSDIKGRFSGIKIISDN